MIVVRVSVAAAVAGLGLSLLVGTPTSAAEEPQSDRPPSSVGRPTVTTPITSPALGEGEVLVRYRTPGATDPAADFRSPSQQALREQLNERVGAVAVREVSHSAIEVVRLDAGVTSAEAVRAYESDPAVASAEPNQEYTTQQATPQDATPQETITDPLFGRQWALENTGQNGGRPDADIDARAAWGLTKGSRSVVVVVIDSGIAHRHPDLAGNVWRNPGEIAGDGIDNDRNGYVDDLHGYDVVDDDGNPADPNGHGTHVAGTIGALGGNRIGVAGVSWRVQIAGCRFLDANGSGTTDGAIACLDYVKALRRTGVNVVATNNSWGGGAVSPLLRRAIQSQQEVLYVAAAGNDSLDLDLTPSYPASYELPNVISVAASDEQDQPVDFSNRGRGTVSLSAPGTDIVSLRAPGTDMYGDGEHFVPEGDSNTKYYSASGTSMAAPHVTGVIALLRSRYPDLDWRATRNRILAGGDRIGALAGSSVTSRRLNAHGSLDCSGHRVLSSVGRPPTFPLAAGESTTLRVLNINCAKPAGPVHATTSTGARIPLHDDGISPDQAAGDGVYAATFTPALVTESITFSSGDRAATVPGISISRYLPQAQVGVDYLQSLRVYGATAPYRWTLAGGSLPPGTKLNRETGVVSGTPTAAGRTRALLRVGDALGRTAVAEVYLTTVADSYAETLLAIDHGPIDVIPQAHAVDADHNTVVVGYYIDPATGREDFAVKKYDPDGTLLWTKLRTSNTPWRDNWATAVAVDEAGNSYVVGGFPYFRSDSDFLLVKYDPAGNEVWTTTYSEGRIEFPSGVTVDPAGDIIVTGSSSSGGASEVLTTKFHPTGDLVWAKRFQVGVLDNGFDLDTDAAGNIYIAGRSGYVFATSGEFTDYAYSYLGLKYSAAGDLSWANYRHNLDRRDFQGAQTIAVDDAGNSYLGGPLNGNLEKYAPDGSPVWGVPVTTAHDFDVRDVALADDGDVVVAGSYFDFSENRRVNELVSVDASGNTQWARQLGGDFNDSGLDVTVDASDLIRLTMPSDRGIVLTSFRANLAITTTDLAPALRGEEYHQKLRARGGVRPLVWEISTGTLPAGLELDPVSGVISGIPTSTASAEITVTVRAADGVTDSANYTLEVAAVAIDPFLGPDSVPLGEPWQFELTARGSAPPFVWSVANGELPPGITIDPVTGILSGTASVAGSYQATIRASDADGNSATVPITIVVVEPLIIETDILPDGTVGVAYDAQLTASGGRPPYQWGWVGDPVPGLDIHFETGIISGVPTTPGVYPVEFFVFDQTPTATYRSFTVVVN